MKRIFCIAIVLVFLCGCSDKGINKFQLNHGSLSTVFSLSVNEEEYKGYMSFDKNLNSFYTLSEPENLCGYSVSVVDNQITVSYEKTSYTYSEGELPELFPVLLLSDGINSAFTECTTVKANKNGFNINGDKITIQTDYQGNIKSAVFNAGKFTFG